MSPVANSLECRLLCASNCAYTIQANGPLPVQQPYYDAVGFTSAPTAFVAGLDNINACFVGTNQDGVILSFRGTLPPNPEDVRTILDWLNDFHAVQIRVNGIPGQVHEGFWHSLDSLWGALVPEIQRQMQAIGDGARLFITGHSKGGAIAHLAAMRLKLEVNLIPTAIYSYAGARSGDREFATAYQQHFNQNGIRYEFTDDMVPHLPPAAHLVGLFRTNLILNRAFKDIDPLDYASVGLLRFIDWHGNLIEGGSSGLEAERFARLIGLISTGHIIQIAKDHFASCGNGYMSHICPPEVCR